MDLSIRPPRNENSFPPVLNLDVGFQNACDKLDNAAQELEFGGQRGPLPPEKIFGPLLRHRAWSSPPTKYSDRDALHSPSTPRSCESGLETRSNDGPINYTDFDARGLIWLKACTDILAAVRADGSLIIWTIEGGERGVLSLLKVDLLSVTTQELQIEGGLRSGDKGKIRQGLLSSIFTTKETGFSREIMVGPHGMCPYDEYEDGRGGVWCQRFALLERAGGRVLLSAGHPDGTVHSFSIGAGQVSRMQVNLRRP